MAANSLPTGAAPWNPAVLLATWFGSGLLPKAPGTWGSLFALPFAWVIHAELGPWGLVVAAVLIFLVGCWAATQYCRMTHEKDPRAVVIDEVAAQWLTLAAGPLSLPYYALGFLLFRAADIIKPFPASWGERAFASGLGVMADDVLAAPYAMIALWAVATVFE
jgi:phosphatidylglycerophosphatase A